MSGLCKGHFRFMTGSYKLGIISIVKFTHHLETEGFSDLLNLEFNQNRENVYLGSFGYLHNFLLELLLQVFYCAIITR